MSIFSRRKIEIDPEDRELVRNMSAQNSDTSLFQTKTINITKISQNTEAKQQPELRHRKSKKQNKKPSKMSDSFMPSTFQEKELRTYPERDFLEETIVESEFIRPLDAKINIEDETIQIAPLEIVTGKKGITSELDQEELTDYMHKTDRVNRVMVSLIVGAIVIAVVVIIIILILNLGKSGQTSPLGGV